MIDIYILDTNINNKKYSKITDFNINIINKAKIEEYKNKIKDDISKNSIFYFDYLRLYIAYENKGLIVDGDIEIVSDLTSLLLDDLFLGYNNTNTILTNIIYTKTKHNDKIRKVLDVIKKQDSDVNSKVDITDIFSLVFNVNFKSKINTTLKLKDNITIYSYDYFYPIDYEGNGKKFTENTKIIFYKNSKLSYKQALKLKLFKKYGASSSKYLSTMFDVFRFNLARKKYALQLKLGIGINNKRISSRVKESIKLLDKYQNAQYIIIHNPYWLGVTSATKELFTNLLPLEELYKKQDIEKLARKICNSNINQVIFSSFNFGWDKLAYKLKEYKKSIKIKVFWHGSNSQVIESQNWITNVKALNLQKEGIVDVFATCKESMLEFYKYHGYNVAFIKNNVNLNEDLINEISKLKMDNKSKSDKLKIGIYSANMDWRKNMFNQLAAASLINSSEIYSIPLNFDAQVFCSRADIEICGLNKSVSREELLTRMSQNDINLYVTFSECAPMLPIESMELGVICITGNTHHYFKGTSLEDYLVVDREDDVISISEKIIFALENKEEIFRLYRQWKNNYNKESKKSVEDFLSI